ncbi:hypothetical protein F4811DRAFT_554072 [Daldinia bambusicola]|nr:hypothetical protein F4811DRAFT_554072 [Daldinia bambusicola]
MGFDYAVSEDSKEFSDSMTEASQAQPLMTLYNKAHPSTEMAREADDCKHNHRTSQSSHPFGHFSSSFGHKNEVLQSGERAHKNEIDGNENKVMQVHGESITLRQILFVFGAILLGLWLSWVFH